MAKFITRYDKYKDERFDVVMLKIRNGTIKSGRCSHLVKIDENDTSILKRKELFGNGDSGEQK